MGILSRKIFRRAAVNILKGGKADRIPPSAFPAKKVEQGAKVESEHTSNKQVAAEIAQDHLAEDTNYYEKLKKMEKKAFFDELLTISASITKE
jgi:hypothetical protein